MSYHPEEIGNSRSSRVERPAESRSEQSTPKQNFNPEHYTAARQLETGAANKANLKPHVPAADVQTGAINFNSQRVNSLASEFYGRNGALSETGHAAGAQTGLDNKDPRAQLESYLNGQGGNRVRPSDQPTGGDARPPAVTTDARSNAGAQTDVPQSQTSNHAAGANALLNESHVQKGEGAYQSAERMLGRNASQSEVMALTHAIKSEYADETKTNPQLQGRQADMSDLKVGHQLVRNDNVQAVMEKLQQQHPDLAAQVGSHLAQNAAALDSGSNTGSPQEVGNPQVQGGPNRRGVQQYEGQQPQPGNRPVEGQQPQPGNNNLHLEGQQPQPGNNNLHLEGQQPQPGMPPRGQAEIQQRPPLDPNRRPNMEVAPPGYQQQHSYTSNDGHGTARTTADRSTFYTHQTNSYSCSATAMAMMQSDWQTGHPPTAGQVQHMEGVAQLNGHGYRGDANTMADQLRSQGLQAKGYDMGNASASQVKQALDHELDQGHTVVAGIRNPHTGNNHYIYIAGKDQQGNYILGDPDRHNNGSFGHDRPVSPNHLMSMMTSRAGGARFTAGWSEGDTPAAHRPGTAAYDEAHSSGQPNAGTESNGQQPPRPVLDGQRRPQMDVNGMGQKLPALDENGQVRQTEQQPAPGQNYMIDRSQFNQQLSNPAVRAAFAGRMNSEVGTQGFAAQVAFAEEVMNRAASRGTSIVHELSGGYYPTSHPGYSNNPQYMAAIDKAWQQGTDITHGATGNASGHVGFGVRGGHYDAQKHWVSPNQTARFGGERFGWEKVDIDKNWEDKYNSLKRVYTAADQ